MSKSSQWGWDIYFFILLMTFVGRTLRLLNHESPEAMYLTALVAFDPLYYFIYAFCVIQIFLNFFHLIPLAFYVRRIPFLHPRFWQYLLVLRLAFDLIGHPYAVNNLISLYHTNTTLFTIIFAQGILIQLPSYMACYNYAFNKTGIFSKS